MTEAGLAVREGRRDPIDQHPHAAHAELGARPEPANGDPLPQRVVVAVVDLDARYRAQRLIQRKSCDTGSYVGDADDGKSVGRA